MRDKLVATSKVKAGSPGRLQLIPEGQTAVPSQYLRGVESTFFFYMLSHVSLIKSLRNRNHHPHLIDEEVGDVDR